MGWRIKQDVSVNGGVDWSQILLPPGGAAAELDKPPSMRRQQQPEFSKCPRCGSTSTKFCYYNNYSKTQPRYFCKACKRHWTKGGTLRNVPVGRGRKSKRPKKSTSSSTTTTAAAAAVPQHQDCPKFPFDGTANLDHKIMYSSALYHNLSRSSSPMLRDIQKTSDSMLDENGTNNTTNSNVTSTQIEKTDQCDPFSSLGIFDLNYCSNVYQDYTWNLDSAAESTINPTISSVQQWQTVESCSDNMDLANDWNWNEIDELISPDQFKYIMGS